MNNLELEELKEQLQQQETYELFNRMLLRQEPFVPYYQKPVSTQSSSQMHNFNNHYSS
jgi:hypothetical protein